MFQKIIKKLVGLLENIQTCIHIILCYLVDLGPELLADDDYVDLLLIELIFFFIESIIY